MQAVILKHTGEFVKIEVKNRFDFEDGFLFALFPPRSCRKYLEHRPCHQGVRVLADPVSKAFRSRPYLEFEKQVLNEAHFQVMQEGQPTGFKVILD